jgi:hypothetical protein
MDRRHHKIVFDKKDLKIALKPTAGMWATTGLSLKGGGGLGPSIRTP